MHRQRTHHSRITYVLPDDFPLRLKRFKEESGLSWAEIACRLRTYHPGTTMADPRLDVPQTTIQA